MPPVCLIIRDGWGYNTNPKGNAVLAAKTPCMDSLLNTYPWMLLEASGEPVGLPAGYQGSSEVGHLNMGAGRIVIQELKRIDDGLRDGTLFNHPKWRGLLENWRKSGGRLHLLGLLQDEGVHAHQEHLFKIMRRARTDYPQGAIVVHPFLDGRDTPPRSSPEYLAQLQLVMEEVGGASLGVMMGRYYAMDRGRNYGLTDLAFNTLAEPGATPRFSDPVAAVRRAWEEGRTPDGAPMVDEYVPPMVWEGYYGLRDGEAVFHTNFRQDRAIQLSQAFVEPNYPGRLIRRPRVAYLGLTRYYDEFTEYLLEPMGEDGSMNNLLGEMISKAGLSQLRLAETQKFRHVTSFFNGKSTRPSPGEDQVEIKGRFDPASFASHPEMEAYELTREFLGRHLERRYPFIALNYANCDMVGHTGVMEAAVKAVEVVDECLGLIVPALLDKGYHILVTADHGNAEQMIDYQTGLVKTSHTTFPVECVYAARAPKAARLLSQGPDGLRGKLSDLAPTVMKLMELAKPEDMTARSLLAE